MCDRMAAKSANGSLEAARQNVLATEWCKSKPAAREKPTSDNKHCFATLPYAHTFFAKPIFPF
jgi:hypothetical protein